MSVPTSKIPTITLLSSLPPQPHKFPKYVEREINRQALVEVAPDRDDLFLSEKSINDIRNILKIHTGYDKQHWLYHVERKTNFKVREATSPASRYVPSGNASPVSKSSSVDIQVVRRVQSISSLGTLGTSCHEDQRPSSILDIWSTQVLSTEHILISPRPLGPTHIILAYAAPTITSTVERSCHESMTATAPTTFSEILEIPINDLLFTLNIPNLVPFKEDGATLSLPRRLHKELPRVFMEVPHLDTFAELVAYLHTKNQAELFRKLIPEWIRDLMHPLPGANNTHARSFSASYSPDGPLSVLAWIHKKQISRRPFLGILRSGSSSRSSVDSTVSTQVIRRSSLSSYSPDSERSLNMVARELAQAAQSTLYSPFVGAQDTSEPLLRTAAILDALKDNLDHIGYYNPGLWNELEISRDILIRAITFQARMNGE